MKLLNVPDELPNALREIPSEKARMLEGRSLTLVQNEALVEKLEAAEARIRELESRSLEAVDKLDDVFQIGSKAHDVLCAVAANERQTEDDYAKELKMMVQEVTYNLELLEKHNFVSRDASWYEGSNEWALTHKARAHFFNRSD